MFRIFAVGVAVSFFGAAASAPLHAQGVMNSNGCCCGSANSYSVQGQAPMVQPGMQAPQMNQNYQRYSYQPAPAGAPANVSGQQASSVGGTLTPSAPVQQQVPYEQSQMAPASQGYRSYSYQPYSSYPSYSSGSNYNGSRTPLWMYSKGDPRRYRP
jgi:hypothetical protein